MIFKQLPTIISGISQLGEASKKLKALDFSIIGLNTGNIDAYRNAISGISKEQASLLLSTKGLNQAQIDLILSNEKVTASEIAEASVLGNVVKTKSILTVEQQKQLITGNALTSEKLAEVAATIGLETAENGSLVSKKALNVEMVKQQLESIGVIGSTQTQILSMLGLATAETTAATGTGVLSGAIAKLSIAMSTNPIGALITVIGIAIVSVYGLSKAFDSLTDSAEEIDERVDNLISKYNELKTTADNNASTVESLASEYETLSKGVNNLGENVSLTSEEYSRYNEIVNQIAEMFPTLITGYTDEGTAILSLKGNVEELRDAYKEAQQEAYNLLISTGKDSDGNDIMEAYKNLSELDWWDSVIGAEDVTTTVKRDITKQILDLMSNMDTAVEEYDKLAKEIFDTYGDRGYNFLEEMGLPAIKDVFSDTSGITKEALKAGRSTVQSYYQGFQAEIDNGVSNVKLMANAFLNTNDFYLDDSTTDEVKNALSVMINSIDEEVADSFNGSKEKVGAYVNNIVNAIKDNPDAQNAMVKLFTMDTTDMSVGEIQSEVDSYMSIIADAIHEDSDKLKIRLGFDDSDTQPLINKVQGFLKDDFDDKVGTLTLEDLEIASNLEIPDGTLLSWDELLAKIEKVKSETFNNETDISFTDAVSQVQALSKGLDQLDKIYADIYDKEDFDWSSILNNDDFKETFGDMGASYEAFIKQISSTPDDIEACQKAFNDLVTAYLYAPDSEGNNWMKDLSESTKDATVAFLEQKGIVNALEIVENALLQKESALTDSKQTLAQMCSTLAQSVNSEAEAKRIAELESINLDNVTLGELDILIQEAQQLGINTGALINLKLAKFDVNRQSLNLNDDVSSLLAMAKAAGIATEATVKLASIQAGYQEAKRNNNEQAMRSIAVQMEGEKKNLEAEIANFSAPKVDFAGGSSTKPVIDKSTKEASDSAKSATAETIDFIEIAISRLEDAIDKTKSKAESAFRSFSTRNKAYSDAISKTTEKIKLQEQAYNAYMDRANSVGLDESWAKQVRDGSIIIADITDDTLKEQISDYTKWYNKARDCKTAIQDLKLEQKELVQANIDLLITKYDKLISKAESANERIQNKIDVKISWGGSASASDYTKMNTNLSKQISYITKQNKSLVDLQKTVTKGSEAWYEYNEQINSNKASLQELQKQMAENAQAAAALSKANADKKVEKYDSKDELNDAKIDNATTAKSKNSLINKKMSNINGRQKTYDNAVTTSTNRLNASITSINSLKSKKTNTKNKTTNKENKTYNAVLKKVRAQIKAGKRIGTKLLNETTALNDNLALYNACVQYNAYLDAKAENETVAEIYAETAKQEKADLALEKFNNIATEYDYSTSANEQKKTELNNKISLSEAQGRKASIAYYNGLISAENGEQQKLIQKRNALQKSLDAAVANGQIEKGSEEWYEMVDAINEVTNSIDESVEKVVELNNAIRQIEWDTFDDSLETVKRIPGETDFYINFMSKNKDLTDEDSGNFTEYGNAALALHNENYKNYLAQADAYAREYNDIMNQVARGELSLDDENVIQRLRELQDAQRDAKLSAEDELSAIIDLTRQGYEAQLNALSSLIQKYKDLKQNEKDAYEYQKSIAEKTKSIAALQKQLAAYGDNDTEEARAKIQQIKVDLEESKQDLKETEYEKYLSDTNDMLDEMYGDYEDFIDKRLKDTDAILEMINSSIEGMSSGIIATLASLNGGITPELEKLLSGSMSSSDYVNGVIASDKAKQEESMRAAEAQKAQEEKQKAEEKRKNDEEAQRQKAYEAEKARSETNAKREELERQLESEKRNLVELQNKLADLKSDAQHELDAINAVRKKKGQNPLTSLSNVSGYTSRKQEVEAKIKTSKNKIASIQKQIDNLPQYGNGSNYIPYDQLAWTQEKGAEAILRKSDGALLTPLRMGDMVFDNETTHRLLELSSMNPVQLVNGINLTSIPPSLPVIERNVTGGNVSIDLGGINMYGVNDPETFGKQIREEICKNGKTLQCITEGVSSKITGKGTGSTRLFQ